MTIAELRSDHPEPEVNPTEFQIDLNSVRFYPGMVIALPDNLLPENSIVYIGKSGFSVKHTEQETDEGDGGKTDREVDGISVGDMLRGIKPQEDDSYDSFWNHPGTQENWNGLADMTVRYSPEINAFISEQPVKIIYFHRGYPLSEQGLEAAETPKKGVGKLCYKEGGVEPRLCVMFVPLSEADQVVKLGIRPDQAEIWATRRDEEDFYLNQKLLVLNDHVPDPKNGVGGLSGNKELTKRLLVERGLTVPNGIMLEDEGVESFILQCVNQGNKAEFIIKPNSANNGEGVCKLVVEVGDGGGYFAHITYPDAELANTDKTNQSQFELTLNNMRGELRAFLQRINYPYGSWILEQRIPELTIDGLDNQHIEFRFNILQIGDELVADTLCRLINNDNYRGNTCAGATAVTLGMLASISQVSNDTIQTLRNVQELFNELIRVKFKGSDFNLEEGISFDVRPVPELFKTFLEEDFWNLPPNEQLGIVNQACPILEVQALGTLSTQTATRKNSVTYERRRKFLETLRRVK